MAELPVNPDFLWTNEQLQAYRDEGDPLADEVIARLFASGEVKKVNDLMRHLVTNEFPESAGLPDVVKSYLDTTDDLPPWADRAKISAGEQVFWRYGPKLVLILHCYSLPFCYLGGDGAQVLLLTDRLESNPTRRILETAQMLVDVMQPGGLTSPKGRGLRSIQKVRLMHAAVRRMAQEHPTWKKSYGLPINQEDLAGTLMSFSWIGLEGLRKLGVTLSTSDREAYLHCWNVAGYLLGIHPSLIPHTLAHAERLTNAVARHQFRPTEAGKSLTDSLVKLMMHVLPGTVFDPVVTVMMRYFMGEVYASWLGLPEGLKLELLAGVLRVFNMQLSELLNNNALFADVAERVGRQVLETVVFIERGGNRPTFCIPTELRQQWGVNWVS